MPSRRPARRSSRAAVLPLVVTVTLLGACGGRSPLSRTPMARSGSTGTVLACAAEVAEQTGLPVIERAGEGDELRALSSGALAAGTGAGEGEQAVDAVVVSLGARTFGDRVRHGLRVLAQTFHRQAGGAAGANAWQATAPSERAVGARDAILARCGTLGS